MKLRYLSLAILIITLACQTTREEERISSTLRTFYTYYITAISEYHDSHEMESFLDSLKHVYCSPSLLTRIQNEFARGELGYDPFIYAQDANIDCLKTLTIKKDTIIPYYNVSYKDQYSGAMIKIKLKVVKQNDSIKIIDIW